MTPFEITGRALALTFILSISARESLAQQPPHSPMLDDLPSSVGSVEACRTYHLNADRAKLVGEVDGVILRITDKGYTMAGRTFEVGTDAAGRIVRFAAVKSWFMPPRDSTEGVDVKFDHEDKPQGRVSIRARDRTSTTHPLLPNDTASVRRLAVAVLARCRSK